MVSQRLIAIRPVWIGLATTLASAVLFAATANQRMTNIGPIAGAVIISAICVAIKIAYAPVRVEIRLHVFSSLKVFAAMLLLAGYAWSLGGYLTDADFSAARDGSVLLLTGGTVLALVHLPIARSTSGPVTQSVWFLALMLATVTMFAATTLIAHRSAVGLEGESADWVIAGLVALLGLTIVLANTITQFPGVRSHFRPDTTITVSVGWLLLGGAYLVLAVSLLRPERQEPGWWYPLMAAGAFVVIAGSGTANSGKKDRVVSGLRLQEAPIGSQVWAASLAMICFSMAVTIWVARDSISARDWALVAIATTMLVVTLAASTVTMLTHRSQITALSRRAATLLRLSQTDPLTGLSNRRALETRLTAEIQRAARFNHSLTIGIIDIDDFKSINDQYGHATGDVVLRRVAAQLERELRSIDVVGRFGGEEFLMILPETEITGAWVAADRMLSSVRAMPSGSSPIHRPVTVSIGLAAFPQSGRSSPALLEAADAALYEAKREGKNRVVTAESIEG